MTAEDPPPGDDYPGDDIGPFERTVLRRHGRAAGAPSDDGQGQREEAPDPPLAEEPVAEGYEGADIDPFERSVLRGHGRAAETPAENE